MTGLELHYRRAVPADAGQLALMIYDASPSTIDYVFASVAIDPIDYIAHCVRNNIGFYGYEHQHVAVLDDTIALTLTMYEGHLFKKLVAQTIRSMYSHFTLRQCGRLLLKSTEVGRLYSTPAKRSLFVANASVSEPFRGKGLFTVCFNDYVRKYALAAGLQQIEMDVEYENRAAMALYLRLGFREMASIPYKGKGNLSGVTRMTAHLSGTHG